MIDFHTHLLPQIDDGARSAEESAELLRMLWEQGVSVAVATPHFYGDKMTPEGFLHRRQEAKDRLFSAAAGDMPKLLLGAEVAFFEGIGHSDATEALCVEGTRTLLIEMPFTPWTPRMLTEVEDLQERRDLRVVLAHIERYLAMQSREICDQLFHGDLILQMNAGTLLSLRTRRMGLQLLESGRVQVLGSDCHGVEYRPPHMAEAAACIRKRSGEELLTRLDERARELLTPMKEMTAV